MLQEIKKWLLQPRVSAVIIEAAFALFLYVIDPLGLSLQKAVSLNHVFAWLGQFNYPSAAATDKMAVVLIDEESVDTWQEDWPITYARTRGLIHLLACAGAKAVFFDYTLSRKFNLADDPDQLAQMALHPEDGVCPGDKTPAPTRVYFGAVQAVTPGRHFAELQARHRLLPIESTVPNDIYAVGPDLFPDQSVPTDKRSTAFAMAADLCEETRNAEPPAYPGCQSLLEDFPTLPMMMTWRGNLPTGQGVGIDASACREFPWIELLPTLVHLSSRKAVQPCAPILTLSALDLYQVDNPKSPAAQLSGRVVFVGTQLAGLNDAVISPVHGRLPGVYKHAIALDNILTFGTSYPTIPPRILEWFLIGVYYLLIEIIASFAFSVTVQEKHIEARVIALAGVTTIYLGLFVWQNWPVSILLIAVSYYVGAELLSAITAAARKGRTGS